MLVNCLPGQVKKSSFSTKNRSRNNITVIEVTKAAEEAMAEKAMMVEDRISPKVLSLDLAFLRWLHFFEPFSPGCFSFSYDCSDLEDWLREGAIAEARVDWSQTGLTHALPISLWDPLKTALALLYNGRGIGRHPSTHQPEERVRKMPTIETKRLILRDFVPSDWDRLNAFLSDPAVTRFMHFSSWDEGKRREWLTWLVQDASIPQRDAYNWAITLRSNGVLIGWLGIGGSEHASEEGERECGYALDQRFWGQGYLPEALRAVITHEFTVLGTHRIIAECETLNLASARVMQKCGMAYEGMFYDADFEGNWANRYRYSITSQADETL